MPSVAASKLIHQIAITLIPGVGDVLAKNLISYCGGVEQVFKTKKAHLLRIPGVGEKIAQEVVNFKDFERAEKEVAFIEKHKVCTFFYSDPAYPARLKQLDDAPALLYYLGNADLNNAKIVGIVGTRKASEYGKACVERLVADLTEMGCLVLSGLAYGIDIYAHKAALKHQLPTVGVMAHGLDRIYPNQHTATAKKMIDNGGLLTEFMSETNPDRENFPKRNRIVAGLCDVLIVVETAERGGAMITAELANGYNKDVAAFPGRVNDEYSKGCNKLIKSNKATLITGVDDLYYLMGWNSQAPKPQPQQVLMLNLSAEEAIIYNYIKTKNKVGIDEMAFELQIDSSNLSLQLLEMEFKGVIRTLPGKQYELV
jgi:DNA processing protein